MNILAKELNKILEGSSAERLLSEAGKRFFFPKGIVAQSQEAAKKAHRFNATVGMSYEHGQPMILPALQEQLPTLTPKECVDYSPTAGVPLLRDEWKVLMGIKNPSLDLSKISNPLVVPGLTSGVAMAAYLFLEENDNLILPDIYWGNYKLIIEERLKANLSPFTFFTEDGRLNISGLVEAIKEKSVNKKAAMLLNFPNNPSGYTPYKSEVQELRSELIKLADEGYAICIMCDDAYYGLFYEEGIETESLFAHFFDAHENILAVKVDGATKEDYVWGFRTGFVTFGAKGMTDEQYDALENKLKGVVRATVSSSATLSQNLLLHTIVHADYAKQKAEKNAILEERYKRVKEVLKDLHSNRLKTLPFNSGYFMSFDCIGISADELRLALLEKGIGTISLQNRLLRIAYASVDVEDIKELYQEIFESANSL